MNQLLTIVRADATPPSAAAGETIVGTAELRRWLRHGTFVRQLLSYHDARLLTYRLRLLGRPLFLAALARLFSRAGCWIEDQTGERRDITLSLLARWATDWLSERLRRDDFVVRIVRDVELLERRLSEPADRPLDVRGAPVYLRTDLTFHLQAGGSVGHVAGVLNTLGEFAGAPVFITTDGIPTVASSIETHLIDPPEAFWNFRELPSLALNPHATAAADRVLAGRALSFVYHRYCVNTFAAVQLALARRVPLVLEYNGSEVWVSRHWGKRLAYEGLTERIERLNLLAADLIVVVSRALADELAGRGISRDKILINPNGVDPERYSPMIDGSSVRARHGLDGNTIVGFIGTFGPWHGAEQLARAFARVVRTRQAQRDLRLLMIGDGARLEAVRRIVSDGGIDRTCVFTGVVPQQDGPKYLAACDVLVAPHVPNPDGTPFFGSPTKLFEYMAMGKGIVASNLDQIGEVIEHGRTGWLVRAGDPEALADGIELLVSDVELRVRLGQAARTEAVAAHTWRQHTRRIVERLNALKGIAVESAREAASHR